MNLLKHTAAFKMEQFMRSVEAEITSLRAENEMLREALHEWDALIRHQYSGSREAMSDIVEAAQNTAQLLYGDPPWPEPAALKGDSE